MNHEHRNNRLYPEKGDVVPDRLTLFEQYSRSPVHVGRMNDPTGSAWIKGDCGDTMEVYLTIVDDVVTEALYQTDGCGATHACGSFITEFASGKHILDALGLSPKEIINKLGDVPEGHWHCAILAASTLHKAIADYLLKPRY
jgi:nitrogen fixation NifU-like protein